MKKIMTPGTAANLVAKVFSLALALMVMTYLVYCAHDAAKDGSKKRSYMGSPKATPFEPTPGELVTEEIDVAAGAKKTKKKKDGKDKKED